MVQVGGQRSQVLCETADAAEVTGSALTLALPFTATA